MIHDPFIVPPLPPEWPYAPGITLAPLGCRLNQNIPGFGGGWRVCTSGGLSFTGDATSLPGAMGRGGIMLVGDVVMKPYLRGGLLRHLNERTYRSHLRFAAEHAVHRGLWESGFPTVEPMGYAWRPKGLGVEGILFTRKAEGSNWPQRWDLTQSRLAAIQAAFAALCSWGLWSPDLNATNILLPPEQGALFLDWDRAHFTQPGHGLWRRYSARMLRSLHKLGAPPEAYQVIEPEPHPG
jgi:hypothetical protein